MSDTVKLIIEIPKNYLETIKHTVRSTAENGNTPLVFEIIADGTPLDDVKAEIQANMYCDKDTRLVKNANASGLEKAIEILDNIGKAESDDISHIFDGVTEIPKDAFKGWTTEKPLKQIRAESEDKE